ncbi:hypothetical protein [Gordoniibacillus kamchatkensis]|uniref:hypothetical protein n=1 Tax=Gordoniibacillus kamchatkensis TaxID=1590651 RepID=UPI0006972C43|nr:hypothetical protein [Paenibacillus sp. VKM B-2647]
MRSGGILGTVGILTAARAAAPGFAGETFCRELCAAGKRLGLDVFAFTPESVRHGPDGVFVQALRPGEDGSGWRAETAKMPDVVYDRHFAASRAELARYRAALQLLAAQAPGGARLLGGGLPGKRAVQRMLARDPELAPHLPPTARCVRRAVWWQH